MSIGKKQAAIVLGVLAVGILLFIYTASQVIIFTKSYTSHIEVSLKNMSVSSADVYGALNRMEEVKAHPNECPDRLGNCWSSGGEIRILKDTVSTSVKRLYLSTEELSNVWSPPTSPDRHEAFVQRVLEAFLSEGFIAVEVND